MTRLGGQMQHVGAAMAVMTAPLAIGLSVATTQAIEFDEAMTNVGAVLGRSADEMTGLNEQILAIGSASRYGPQAAAEAFYDIVGGVSDASSHMAILNASIATAEAGNADLTGTTSALISVMNSYRYSAQRAGFASDILTQLVAKGVGTMDEFAAALPQVAGLAAANGVELENLAASMAYLTTTGATASEAATQLSGVMTAFLNPNAAMQAALEEMGVESGSAALEMYGLAGATGRLQRALGGSTDEMASALGSVEALRGAIALNNPAFEEFIGNFEDTAAGATDMAQEIQNASRAAQLDHLKAQISGLAIKLGDSLLPVVSDLATNLTPLVGAITDWISANPELTQQILAIGGALILAGPLIAGAGTLLTAIGTAATVASGAIAVLLSPVFLLAAGIGAIMAAGGTLDSFLNDLGTAVTDLKLGFEYLWMATKPIFSGGQIDMTWLSMGLSTIGKALSTISISLFENVTDAIENLTGLDVPSLQEIGTSLVAFKDKLIEFFSPALQSIAGGLTDFAKGITGFLANLSTADTSGLDEVGQQLLGMAAGVGAFIAAIAEVGLDAAGGILSALSEQLPALGTALASIVGAISAAGEGDVKGFLTGMGEGIITLQNAVAQFGADALMEIVDAIGNLIGVDISAGLSQLNTGLVNAFQSLIIISDNIQRSLEMFFLTMIDTIVTKVGELRQVILDATATLPTGAIDIAPMIESTQVDVRRQLEDMQLASEVQRVLAEQMAAGTVDLGAQINFEGAASSISSTLGRLLSDPTITENMSAAMRLQISNAITAAAGAGDEQLYNALVPVATNLNIPIPPLVDDTQMAIDAATAATFMATAAVDLVVTPGYIDITAVAAQLQSQLNGLSGGSTGGDGVGAGGTAGMAPTLDTGGTILSDGLVYAHAGEVVLNERQQAAAGLSGSGGGDTYNVYGESPYEVAEMVDRARRNRANG
jgi:TP901 family phage tail tape measure protein